MKIRVGFVSNSSSSSFCIYGREIGEDDVEKLKEKFGIDDENDDDMRLSVGNKIEEETNLSVHHMYDSLYVGRSFTNIKDNETGAQFKKDVEDNIKTLLNTKDAECSIYEESWND